MNQKVLLQKVCSPNQQCIIKFSFQATLSKKKDCLIFLILGWFSAEFLCFKTGRNENFVLQCGYGEQTLWRDFIFLCSKKLELMKQIHLFKTGFVIFLKGASFSDFFDNRLSNYKPLAIRVRFSLFRGFSFN